MASTLPLPQLHSHRSTSLQRLSRCFSSYLNSIILRGPAQALLLQEVSPDRLSPHGHPFSHFYLITLVVLLIFLWSLCWFASCSSCIILLFHGFGGSEVQEGLVSVVLALDVSCGFCDMVTRTATAGAGVAGGRPGISHFMGFRDPSEWILCELVWASSQRGHLRAV